MTTLTIYKGREYKDDKYVVTSDTGIVYYSGKELEYIRKYDVNCVIVNEFVSVSALEDLLKEEQD